MMFSNKDIPIKQLKVDTSHNVRSYLWIALKLCVVLSDEGNLPWYYMNFINTTRYSLKDSGILKIDYEEYYEYDIIFSDILDIITYSFKELSKLSICSFLVESINREQYVEINIDEFFLKSKSAYLKTHYIHPVLVYGYDIGSNIFYCLRFNNEMLFERIIVTFEEMKSALLSCCEIKQRNTELSVGIPACRCINLKEKKTDNYYNSSVFISRLNNYLNSKIGYSIESKVSQGQIYDCEQENGINSVQNIIQCMKKTNFQNLSINYPDIYFLAEHKQELYKKLKFCYHSLQKERCSLFESIEQYSRIAEKIRSISMRILKERVKGKDIFQDCIALSNYADIIFTEIEKDLLHNIIKELSQSDT